MTELAQVIEKLNSLEKGHDKILTAIVGDDRMGQKGLVHRISDVEKVVVSNTGDIQAMKTIKEYNVKKLGIILGVMTIAVPTIFELVRIIYK